MLSYAVINIVASEIAGCYSHHIFGLSVVRTGEVGRSSDRIGNFSVDYFKN